MALYTDLPIYRDTYQLILKVFDHITAMIHEPSFSEMIQNGLFVDIKFIHRLGNIETENLVISATLCRRGQAKYGMRTPLNSWCYMKVFWSDF